jgi:type VI secretion system secreted protein VgrG
MASVFSFDCAPLPAETRVVGFLGEEGISALYRFEVWLAVPDAASDAVDLDALIGLRVTLRAHAVDGSLRRSTHGVVIEAAWDEGSLLRVTLAPKLWLATLDRHSKVYVDKSFREVLDATLQAAGLAPDDDFVLRHDSKPVRRTVGVYTHRPDGARPPRGARVARAVRTGRAVGLLIPMSNYFS